MRQEIQPIRCHQRFYPRASLAVPAVRRFVREALGEWAVVEERVEDVVLCASELATNAVVHGAPPGRGFVVHVSWVVEGFVVLEVHDSGGGRPRVRHAATGEGGRGLFLVEALADKWGVTERRPGKIVWAEFGI